jgi:hypothetical protein
VLQLANEFGILVENYSGGKGRIPALNRNVPTIRVCTIEKGAMLVNSLLEDPLLMQKLGMLIVWLLFMSFAALGSDATPRSTRCT